MIAPGGIAALTSKPIICAINGPVQGGGCEMALSCDLRIAADTAKFGTAYAKVGLGGDYGATWQLTQLVGEAKAKEKKGSARSWPVL